jgi:hypothetical protein
MAMAIAITCPSCGNNGDFEIPVELFKNTSKGLAIVNVPAAFVCEHSFQIFIDRNGAIRGYQRVDFELELKREIRSSVEDVLREYKRVEISVHGMLSLLTSDIFLRIVKNLLLKSPITVICSNLDLIDVLKSFFSDKFPDFAKSSFIPEFDYGSDKLNVAGLVVDLNMKMVNQDPIKHKFLLGQDWVKEVWQHKDAGSQKISFTSFINNLFNHYDILRLFIEQQTGTIKFENLAKLFREKAKLNLQKDEIEFLLELLKIHDPELERQVETFEKRVKNIDLF